MSLKLPYNKQLGDIFGGFPKDFVPVSWKRRGGA